MSRLKLNQNVSGLKMINIDYLTISAFIKENRDFIISSRIQKIRQSSPRDLVLVLRNNGESRKLYINISPELYHLCFMSPQNEEKRLLEYPKNPPMFCMLLRKYLENAKITNITQPYYERIVEFELETKTDFEINKKFILAVELMGKYSNIVLYDKTNSIIIGCAHNVGENKSQIRELYGGIPYVYPPVSNKKDLLRYFWQVNYEYLSKDFLGISKYFESLCKGLELEQIKDCMELKNINPAITEKEYSIFGDLILGKKEFVSSVNQVIDEYYSREQYSKKISGIKSSLLSVALAKSKKVKNSLAKITTLRSRRDNTEKYKLYGELLTAYAYMGKDYISEIELTDYNSGEQILIPLDETLSMIDNAKWYFKLYTKSKRTREKTIGLINSLNEEKEYWEQVVYSIENADSVSILNDIKEELGIGDSVNKKVNSVQIEPQNISGYVVYIGRNNKQNDYIVSKIAKENDVWFHIKGHAGSHVLLKITDSSEPDEKIIFECCKLAKKYSSVPENEKSGVIYTKRKYLRKPPAAALGYVTYKNEKEIYL